jgi:hypothetical protein
MPETQATPRFQCRHIHASGHRCASPSLRHETFCYFHHSTRKPIAQQELALRRGKQATFRLPEPEDRTAIQLAIGEILHRLAANDLDNKRAGLMLYALQIASSNLPKSTQQTAQTVEDIVQDATHGPLAPEAEFHSAPHEKSLEQILLEQWHKDDLDEAERATQDAARVQAESEPWTAPPEDFDPPITIQACASSSKLNRSKLKAREPSLKPAPPQASTLSPKPSTHPSPAPQKPPRSSQHSPASAA